MKGTTNNMLKMKIDSKSMRDPESGLTCNSSLQSPILFFKQRILWRIMLTDYPAQKKDI